VALAQASGVWTGRSPSPWTSGWRAPPSLPQMRGENPNLPSRMPSQQWRR
jgi:hypothetical protein